MSDANEPSGNDPFDDPKVVRLDKYRKKLSFEFYGVVKNIENGGGSDLLLTVAFLAGLVDEAYLVDRSLLYRKGKALDLQQGALIGFNVAALGQGLPDYTAQPYLVFHRITAIAPLRHR